MQQTLIAVSEGMLPLITLPLNQVQNVEDIVLLNLDSVGGRMMKRMTLIGLL